MQARYMCPKNMIICNYKKCFKLSALEKINVGLNSTTEILWIHYRKAAYLKLACACKYDDDKLVDVTGVAYVEGSTLLESEGELMGSMSS